MDRMYLVCLNLLIMLTIVVASIVWFIAGGYQTNKIVLSSTPITSKATTESTTTFTRRS